MRVVYADRFKKQFDRLPARTQIQFKRQMKIFLLDWRDTRLHTKKLVGETAIYSIRITRDYRALFEWIDDVFLFSIIAHRKDVYLP